MFKLYITVEAYLTILAINDLDTPKEKEKEPARTPTISPDKREQKNEKGKKRKRGGREGGRERKILNPWLLKIGPLYFAGQGIIFVGNVFFSLWEMG